MKADDLLDLIGEADDGMITEAKNRRKRSKNPWVKWAAAAACLCLAAALPFVLQHRPEAPSVSAPEAEMPNLMVANGTRYFVSGYFEVENELPDGFTLAGETNVGGYSACPYYLNQDIPEWAYVYHEVRTNGEIDSTGTLINTEPHYAYVLYVDERLRGKDLVVVHDEYYISLWSANYYGDEPDVSREYYDSMVEAYGVRFEGSAPDGFASIGVAEFTGHDTIPRGALASNQSAHEVFMNPEEPDIVLVPTSWYTHTREENQETMHTGFNVYVLYDCPFK